MIEYCLLYPITSVENFLTENFHCSKNTLKFYFDKKFLKRSFEARTVLKLPLNFVNDLKIFPKYEGPEIKILFEDETFLVLNKPANIFSHSQSFDEKNNCLSYLREIRSEVLNVNPTKYDRGLLYRLDYETSGVLVYVKREEAYQELRSNFKDIAKEKKYLCWVEGNSNLAGNFTHYFKSSGEKGKKILVSDHNLRDEYQVGQFILTPKDYNHVINATLMEVILGQGLRHQIRAQLAFLGFPLRGDVLYGGNEAQRLYLHALLYKILFKNRVHIFEVSPSGFDGV